MTRYRPLDFSVLIGLALLCGAQVASAQVITPSPQALSFTYQMGGANPPAQSIFLSADVPTQFTVSISGAPWLTVSPSSGLTPATLTVIASAPQNAAPGTLNGSIIIGPPASTDAVKTVVAVSMQVLGPAQGNLTVNPSSLLFEYRVGAPFPPPQSFFVFTTTNAAAAFNISVTTSSGGPWLTVAPNSYVTPSTVLVSAIPNSTMGPGTYNGLIKINPNGGGPAQSVFVALVISAAGTLTAAPAHLAFNYQVGGTLPFAQIVNVASSTGGPVVFNVSASTIDGAPWLNYSPTVATTPYGVAVSVNPAGLVAGTYYGTLNISPQTGGVLPTQLPVTLTVYGTSQLVVDPSSLTFDYQLGGPVPAAQVISITSTGAPVSFTANVIGASWIRLSSAAGTTPTGVSVSLAPPSGTPPGTYTANVTFIPTGAGNAISVPVTARVTEANYLTVGRTALSFNYSTTGQNPPPEIVPVASSGSSLRFTAAAATAGFAPWLHVVQSSQYTPANLTVSVTPKGLSPGVYSGVITVLSDEASNGQQTVNVTLTVTAASLLTASPFALLFSYQTTFDSPPPQAIGVNAQGTAVAFSTSASTSSGGNWLMAVGSGTTPATIVAAVNPGGLGPGTYTGSVVLKPADQTQAALEVPVVLNVSAAPVFQLSANVLSFQFQKSQAAPKEAPSPKKVTVKTNSTLSTVFYPTAVTGDGGQWLKVTPDIGATPSEITVSVDPSNLAVGLYYGLVALTDAAGDVPTSFIPVTLAVSDNQVLDVPGQPLLFLTQVGMANPAAQTITIRGVGASTPYHAVPFGGPWLHVTPTDGFTDAVLTVSVSMEGLTAGYYLGGLTVEVPGVAGQQIVPVALVVAPTP